MSKKCSHCGNEKEDKLEKWDEKHVLRTIDFQGLEVAVQVERGMYRHFYDEKEQKHDHRLMSFPYGYFVSDKFKLGKDKGKLDVYVGDNYQDSSNKIYVVEQMQRNNWNKKDEDKVLVGFQSKTVAKTAYLENYDDPRYLGDIKEYSLDEFLDKYLKNKYNSEDILTKKALPMQKFPINPNQMFIPSDDPETPEGVDYLLGRINKMSDEDVKETAGKIWGAGTTQYRGRPEFLKNEVLGILLDKKEEFQKLNQQPQLEMQEQPSLLNSSKNSMPEQQKQESQLKEVSYGHPA